MKKNEFKNMYDHFIDARVRKDESLQERDQLKFYGKTQEKVKRLLEKNASSTRRSFLDMVGKAGFSSSMLKATPLLAAALGTRHVAAQGAIPKRAIFYYLPSGSKNGTWMPSSQSSMNQVTGAYEDVADVCHFREVNTQKQGHTATRQAMGALSDQLETVDSRIASATSGNVPYPSIFCASENVGATRSGRDLFTSIGIPKSMPSEVIEANFLAELPGGADLPYKAAFDAQKKAIENIQNKLGADEKERLEKHYEAIDALIGRFDTLSSQEGSDPADFVPNIPSDSELSEGSQVNMIEHPLAQADVLVAALAAGLTNVGVLQIGFHESGFTMSYGDGSTSPTFHQGLAHAGISGAFEKMHTEMNKVAAHVIRKLKTTNGPEGEPLINSTVFVQVTCMGEPGHDSAEAPFLIATKMPGFKSGFTKASPAGTSSDFLSVIPAGMGLPESLGDGYGGKGDACGLLAGS